jgi:hypothetical protein
MVDLTGTTSRTVKYDITERWTWTGRWAKAVKSGADIVPLLMESSDAVEQKNLEARMRMRQLHPAAR